MHGYCSSYVINLNLPLVFTAKGCSCIFHGCSEFSPPHSCSDYSPPLRLLGLFAVSEQQLHLQQTGLLAAVFSSMASLYYSPPYFPPWLLLTTRRRIFLHGFSLLLTALLSSPVNDAKLLLTSDFSSKPPVATQDF